MLCKYKDLFGKVDTGIHSYRIANIAIVDVLLTGLFAYIISLLFPKCNFYEWYGASEIATATNLYLNKEIKKCSWNEQLHFKS